MFYSYVSFVEGLYIVCDRLLFDLYIKFEIVCLLWFMVVRIKFILWINVYLVYIYILNFGWFILVRLK